MSMETYTLEYHHDGVVLEGFVAHDPHAASPRPGVLVAHQWGGRNPFVEQKAVQLAQLGYVGFALDVYGKGVRGATKEECENLMAPFIEDRPLLQARLAAALGALRELPFVDANAIAAIGYCFGGLCVLDIARTGENIAGVASFHGLLMPADNVAGRKISAKVLVLHGFDDPLAEPDAMMALTTELTLAEADWQIHAYGHTKHAFTNPVANDHESGMIYNSAADRRAHRSMIAFLEECLE